MSIEQSQIAARMAQQLQSVLQPTVLEVRDESAAHAGHAGANGTGYGTHFRVRIASPFFTDLTRVARHRLVYDALQEFIDQGVHAIAIETL
jgi:BolA protein